MMGGIKKYSASVYLFLLISSSLTAAAQTKVIKEVAVRPPASNQGVDLYNQYCSVCHGKDGKGAGPAADALKTRPTDLTQIAHRWQRAGRRLHNVAAKPQAGPSSGSVGGGCAFRPRARVVYGDRNE